MTNGNANANTGGNPATPTQDSQSPAVTFARRKSDSLEASTALRQRASSTNSRTTRATVSEEALVGNQRPKGISKLWSLIKTTFIEGQRPAPPSRHHSLAIMHSYEDLGGAGRDSPLLDFATKDRSAMMKMKPYSEMVDEWRDALDAWGFPAQFIETYSNALAEECVTVEMGSLLTNEQLQELKIKVGHWKDLRSAASSARRTDRGDAYPLEQTMPTPAMTAPLNIVEPTPDGIAASRADYGASAMSPLNTPGYFGDRSGDFDGDFCSKHRVNNKGLQWFALSGGCGTLADFYNRMTSIRQQLKFPKNFDRAFLDNKPMPFTDQDGVYTLVVLRIPDLTNESGTTVATITNRLVVMFSSKHRILLTYHRCDVDPLDRIAADWERGVHNTSNIYQMVDAVNRCVMKVFRVGVQQLQEQSDVLEDETDLAIMVESLTLVQKKAAVYKRCLKAGRNVLEELKDVRGLEDYIPVVCEAAETYEAMMDEVSENALGSINMQMAVDGFHSSRNTKVFTYISLVCQPITLATGWYGMNFVVMPELEMESAYYVFIAIVVPLALSILVAFLYQFEFKVGGEQHLALRSSALSPTDTLVLRTSQSFKKASGSATTVDTPH